MSKKSVLLLLAVLELVLAVVAVAFDLLLPALVIAAVGVVMLLIRRESFDTLGYRKQRGFMQLAGACFLWAVLWTAVDFGLLLPILTRIAGETRDLSGYQQLKGNVGMLLYMLAAGWVLGGFLEEFAFRGVLMARARSLLWAISATVAMVSSARKARGLNSSLGVASAASNLMRVTTAAMDLMLCEPR